MGHFSEEHIKEFVEGKTIASVTKLKGEHAFNMHFTDGSRLLFYTSSTTNLIATPINKDGTIPGCSLPGISHP